jgi:hypothetical protein
VACVYIFGVGCVSFPFVPLSSYFILSHLCFFGFLALLFWSFVFCFSPHHYQHNYLTQL